MNKLTPLNPDDPKWKDYQPHMGKLTVVVAADFLPALQTSMAFLHMAAGETANPSAKETVVARTAVVQYENIEISPTLFAILEYLRITGRILFWCIDDSICNPIK